MAKRMKLKKRVPPFVQIAVGSGGEDAAHVVYGLDDDGRVWRLYEDSKSSWEQLTTESDVKESV
jgi:hypothetical protein